jgi:6-pyruvoyltetrahydropterin/6-carboxytetrahydropterin synthase
MYAVTKVIHFCYGHRLLNYQGKCRYLHGHNGKVDIELSSERLDRRGMVRDFEEIKQTIQRWIDQELDHKMLLNREDRVGSLLRQLGEPVLLMATNPTAEAIAHLIFDYTASKGFPVTAVRVWETDRSVATYQRAPALATRRRLRAPGRVARPRRAALRSTSTAA